MIYRGSRTKEISFPLGGIGTGCVGLSGRGALVDWSIRNRPNRCGELGCTHFAIKAEDGKRVLDARVLNGPLQPGGFAGGGHGVSRATLAGLPHFADATFTGEYPVAKVAFKDRAFPGRVCLTGWSPLIPLNDADSSIPGAFFEIEVRNTTKRALTYTVALTMQNSQAKARARHQLKRTKCLRLLRLGADDFKGEPGTRGDMTLATDATATSHQQYWFRGPRYDNLGVWWRDFLRRGKLKNRIYDAPAPEHANPDHGVLAAHLRVAAGRKERVRFVITWNFPDAFNYWDPEPAPPKGKGPTFWKPYYATRFEDSLESADYALTNYDRLWRETRAFKDALFSSTVPEEVLDAVSANISILKSPTVLRLEDGSFYGFEGCHDVGGCCEGSCTHVWNYAYALPFLFPKLERSMRDLNFRYNVHEDGGIRFRLLLPPGRGFYDMHPCCDGQFGDVMKTYRDWKISGRTDWLRGHWKTVKTILEFAWSKKNADRWDPDKSGVLTGRQHHTLDMELYGPNSWLTSMYLGALKAASEMAKAMDEPKLAKTYLAMFDKGRAWVDRHLFNGEYYIQRINLSDKSLLAPFAKSGVTVIGESVYEGYWDAEHKEIKYQIGDGCGIDQVLGQWHANCMGLGEVLDRRHVRKALASIHKYNFKPDMHAWFNPCRLYCLQDEAGTVTVDWPRGSRKPMVPVPYTEETFHGCEYAAASHMIQEGLEERGLALVRGVRDRYDGERRNPWNEVECGSYYARSMASYALLLAYAGFEYDMTRGMIGFRPRGSAQDSFRILWSLEPGWGTFELRGGKAVLKIKGGQLDLTELRLPFLRKSQVQRVRVDGKKVDFRFTKGAVRFAETVSVSRHVTVDGGC